MESVIFLCGVSLLSFFTFHTTILDVGQDSSIPTWYSSINLLACSILLAIISLAERGDRYFFYWVGLSGITLLMSIDEVAKIHERIGDRLGIILSSLELSISQGFFYYSWVIIGISVVSIFGMLYLKFLLRLPSRIKFYFILSGFIFLCGALGFEMLAANEHYQNGADNNGIYVLITAIEELLEKLGVAFFTYALLVYMKFYLPKFEEIRFILK